MVEEKATTLNFLMRAPMNHLSKYLFTAALFVLLSACGGGGGDSSSFTVTRSLGGTTHSCPTQAAFDACSTGDCGQCTCTVGCDPNAPKVKLAVTMAPNTLAIDQPGTLSFGLSNSGAVSQAVKFTLNYPMGQVGYNVIAFSSPCITYALNVGGQSFVTTVIVPANTTSCSFEMQKRFTAAASPVLWTLTDLSKVELQGSLPSVTVTP